MDKRIIFAGTPEFAAVHLKALLDAGIKPVAVYTQPDRPAGRGHKLTPSPVKALALEAGIEPEKVYPHNLRHLFACTYYQKEKDLSHLADLLGHSNINTTRIYTCISGEAQEMKLKNLGLVL